MSNDNITLDSLIDGLSDDNESLTKEASNNTEVGTNAEAKSSIAEELEGVLSKTASENQPGDDSEMNTTDMGNSIAKQILEKVAAEGNNNGNTSGTQAVIEQTSTLVAGQDAATEPTPVQGKTVTETAKAIIDRGSRDGGNVIDGKESLEEGGIATPTSDGTNIDNTPSDLSKTAEEIEDDIEKVAAIATLVDNGIDFDDAVELVKEAEEAILADEYEQIKVASVNALIAEGVDMTSAVLATEEAMDELTKEASYDEYDVEAEIEQIKIASVNELMEEGYDMTSAVLATEEAMDMLEKEASMAAVKGAAGKASAAIRSKASAAGAKARAVGKDAKYYATEAKDKVHFAGLKAHEKALYAPDAARAAAAKAGEKGKAVGAHIGRNKKKYAGGAAALAAGGGGAYYMKKKASAIEGLIDAGYDLEDALFILEQE